MSFRYNADNPSLTIEAVARETHLDFPNLAANSRYQLAEEIVETLSDLIDDAESYEWAVRRELIPLMEDRETAGALAALRKIADGVDPESRGLEAAKLFLRFVAKNGRVEKHFRCWVNFKVPDDFFG